jgi:putative ABC transport system ATP-binding protein
MTSAPALIELRGVTRAFTANGQALEVLRGVDLLVGHGDFLAITGSSGAGKSTMLNILGLLDRPTTGEYLFDGRPTADLGDRERSTVRGAGVGFVFQSFHLLSARTVLENVMLAFVYGETGERPRPTSERRALSEDALHRVGLARRSAAHPGTLSGGERQRVAIARAICTRPRLLLADEPTGNLDRRNSDAVLDLIEELNAGGLTVVVITHDEAVARRAHRHRILSGGRLT